MVIRGTISLLLFALCSGASAETVHSVRPVAAQGSAITDAKLADWAARGTRLLNTDDESGMDVACDVTIKQATNIVRDATIPNLIQTQAERRKLQAVTAGNVVIVDDLRFCGQLFPTTVAGCEGSGPIILVTQNSSAFQTLVHELGHRFGFGHTWREPGCPVPPPASANVSRADFINIMFCRGHSKRLAVTAAQCSAFRNEDFPDLPELLVDVAAETVLVQPATREQGSNIIEFLTFGFDTGTPFEAIAALTEEEIAAVRGVLERPEQRELWSNAAVVLGLRGSADDVQMLIELLQDTAAAATAEDVRARTSAAYGLGFLAQRFPEAGDPGLAFMLEAVRLPQANALTDNDPESLSRALAQAVAYSGNVVATKAVIDAAAAAGRIDAADHPEVQAYVAERLLPPDVRASVAELPVFDADFVESLAAMSVGVATQGLQYAESPTPNPDALGALGDVADRQSIGADAQRALGEYGLERLPDWQRRLPNR